MHSFIHRALVPSFVFSNSFVGCKSIYLNKRTRTDDVNDIMTNDIQFEKCLVKHARIMKGNELTAMLSNLLYNQRGTFSSQLIV